MTSRSLALLFAGLLAGCATPYETTRSGGSCGSLPPVFDAPVVCPPVGKTALTLNVNREAAYGVSIERAPDANGGLRVAPQTVIPFVRPSHEGLKR